MSRHLQLCSRLLRPHDILPIAIQQTSEAVIDVISIRTDVNARADGPSGRLPTDWRDTRQVQSEELLPLRCVHEQCNGERAPVKHECTFHDLKTDHRGRLMLKVRWKGFRSLMYEIPMSGRDHDHGRRINMQSFSRRIARAIVHFLAANAIHIPWDRIIHHHLETGYSTWQPVLTTI
ncbi:hypothetical protein EW146_g436 [Bondarzewia mesenterica]|uniref:DUF6741 domain-containing protein n=1 Tax=Bondarzewia mesenterica TaxID=1095465 RepID=A0A4S4M976_9AGAM|nr:hypothetical protein EW146_g436 [Bondarzewia mesenterica]